MSVRLNLILRDEEIRDADRQSLLPEALMDSGVHRLQATKALAANSLCLNRVPAAARTRFNELLEATPSKAGMHRYTNYYRSVFECNARFIKPRANTIQTQGMPVHTRVSTARSHHRVCVCLRFLTAMHWQVYTVMKA
jgi:hypothetical protein